LADAGFAQDAVLVRLIDAARRRGDVDDAVTRSLALARSIPSAQRLKLVVDCLGDERVSADQRDRGVKALLAFEGLSAADAAFVAAAAVDVAASTPDLALRRLARSALAKMQDSDEGWAQALAHDLDEADTSDVALALRPLLARRGVMSALLVASSTTLERSKALAEALRVLIRGGDASAVIEAVPAGGQPWAVKDALAAALEVTGKSREAADLLAGAVDDDQASGKGAAGFPRRAFLLKASELYVDAAAAGAAARLLVGLAKEDLDDAVLLHARNVVDKSAREGAMGDAARLAAHIARLGGDDKFVLRALACADAAGGDTALHVAGWRLRAGDTRALPLLAHHALEGSATQGYFAAWHALRIGVRSFADNAPADFQKIAALKSQEPSTRSFTDMPSSPSSSSSSSQTLFRARVNKPAARQAAWRLLSADVAASDDIGAARLLSRAGVPMSAAPLEVRLAADPALGGLTARAVAIAEGLESVRPERRAVVVAAFDVCTARGSTTARQRRAIAAIFPRERSPLETAVDAAALGEPVDVKALIKSLKRNPSPPARAGTAALLVSLGLTDLARMLLPAIVSAPVVTDEARVRALRETAGDDLEGLGKLRLSQLQGPRVDVEERIANIAARLARTDLLAESLLRQASLTSAADERATLLARRAAALLETNPLKAKLTATAAFAAHKIEAHARLLVTCSERIDDPRQTEAALAAWQEIAAADDDKQDAALRRAHLLARRMLRPEDAVAVLAGALLIQPSFALFSEKAAIQTELLSDHVGAAMALLAAVDLTNQPQPERNTLRLKAAELLQKDGSSTSMELAISTLCESFEHGNAEGLTIAETLARSHPGPGLARVLDLRLRDTDDVGARRVLVLERARLLAELDDKTGAITLLEAQAVADEIDLGARLQLASWYLADRRILDAALAFESAARIPGLPAAGCGPPAREAASLLAALGDLERAGPLADMAVAAGVTDLEVLSVAEAWHRSHENWASVDELLSKELDHLASSAGDHRREAHLWMERAQVRRDHLNDESGAKKALYRVLELVLDHPRALQMMREEAHKADTWGALRMALFRATETSTDKPQQVAWLREIASIDADKLTDNKAAQATIDRALAIAPDDADAMVLKASLMVRAGEVDGLPILMERLEKRGVTELPGLLHLTRGDALLVAGERAGASTSFRRATEDPETSGRAWDRLIDMADGPAAALPLLEEARRATLDTRRRITLTRKEQRLRTKTGDDDGAAAAAEQILQLEPGDADALKTVRESFAKKRKLKELAPYLLGWARVVDVVEQAAERARRLTEVGTFTLDELGQEAPARALFEEALSLQHDQPIALVRLADIAWASRDDERALDLLDRIPPDQWTALLDDQNQPRQAAELFFRRARCAYALGNADVRERLRQVMRADAKHTGALEMLAKIALEQHDDDAAEMALESLSRAIPPREDPVRLSTVLVDLSQLRSRKKKFDEAAAAAERAFELNTSNLVVLETLAKAREEAGKFVDAAEAWRRIAAVKSGGDRRRALERRAQSLATGAKTKDAASAWLELFGESNDPRHQAEAQELARRSGDAELMKRAGTQPIDPSAPPVVAAPVNLGERVEHTRTETSAGGGALVIQLRANLDENDAVQALAIAMAAKGHGPLDEESARLALIAADRANRPDAAVELAEFRLTSATDPKEVMRLALAAGRIARDKLHDDDRAAALLYQAHQSDAEDVEVRLELTELYARIPRLASHAVTGILQLLRRTPADARIFTLAATLSDGQGQLERATAMRAIEAVLKGKSSPMDVVNVNGGVGGGGQVLGLDREAISSRLAPTGWNSPLQQLVALLGIHLEVALGGPAAPVGAKPLAQASPKSLALAERVDRLLPGRVAQFLIADVERATVVAAGVPQIVLPRELLAAETALLAAIARGIAVVRLGAVITEIVWPGQEQEILDLLRSAMLGQGPRDARTDLLISRLREDEKQQARNLTIQVLEKPDVAGTLQILTRACDRFALVATGSPIAALAVSALPTLLKEPPQRGMLLLQGSVRALELCAFAARDNAWLLRRQQGLSST
jgi:tetratricopeptide (TPR) repeat protein